MSCGNIYEFVCELLFLFGFERGMLDWIMLVPDHSLTTLLWYPISDDYKSTGTYYQNHCVIERHRSNVYSNMMLTFFPLSL